MVRTNQRGRETKKKENKNKFSLEMMLDTGWGDSVCVGGVVQQLLNFILIERALMSVRNFLDWQVITWVLAAINSLKP